MAKNVSAATWLRSSSSGGFNSTNNAGVTRAAAAPVVNAVATAGASNATVALTWAPVAGAATYAITRGAVSVAAGLPSTVTTFTDTVGLNATYTYSVYPVDGSGTRGTPGAATVVVGGAVIGPQPLAITLPARSMLSSPVVDAPYSYQMVATNAVGSVSWSMTTVANPNVFTINASNGVISGTPIQSGYHQLKVTATDSGGNTATVTIYALVVSAKLGTGAYANVANYPSLRTAVLEKYPGFGATLPSVITTSTVGLSAPNDLSSVGWANAPAAQTIIPAAATYAGYTGAVDPTNGYAVYPNVVNITAAMAPNGQYVCTQSNTIYVLQTDLVSNTWCINVAATNVTINLNGHTLTYMNADVTPTYDSAHVNSGYSMDAYGIGFDPSYPAQAGATTVPAVCEVVNGTICTGQGRMGSAPANAVSPGGSGIGYSPIKFQYFNMTSHKYRGLYLRWNAFSTGGIVNWGTSYEKALVEYCTFEDYGGSVKNRTQWFAAVCNPAGRFGEVRYSRFIGCRNGAVLDCNPVHHNEIWLDSWVTNSRGIGYSGTLWSSRSVSVYNNNVYATGVHPQALYFYNGPYVGPAGANLSVSATGNWLESMFTKVGSEFSALDATSSIDDPVNLATGVTIKFGMSNQNMQISGNTLFQHAVANTIVSAKNVTYNSPARSVSMFQYGTPPAGTPPANNVISGNLIVALAADNTVAKPGLTGSLISSGCHALGLGGALGGYSFQANRIISNANHIWAIDSYSGGEGLYADTGSPQLSLIGNTFETGGSAWPAYSFLRDDQLSAVSGKVCQLTLQANTYKNGIWTDTTYTPASPLTSGTIANGSAQYNIAANPTSGSTPFIWSNAHTNCTYTLLNEPAATS
jgi:hypothetical protein